MIYNKKTAFTLVELIVVITILSILATIAFVSFQWYTVTARDSTRVTEIRSINKLLDFYKLENNFYPLPDTSIQLTASGKLIGYQWYAGTGVFSKIWYSNSGMDPLDETFYTYYTLPSGSNMQLLTFIEQDSLTQDTIPAISSTFADNLSRTPIVYGNKLWIITDTQAIPVQSLSWATDIDITKTTTTYRAILDTDTVFEGTWDELRYAVPLSSCQRLADANMWGSSWYYTIYPINSDPVEVYCNFETAGVWLTLIARSVDDVSFNGDPFGWFVSSWSPQIDGSPYSLGTDVREIPFQNVYLTTYDSGKNITGTTTLDVNDVELFNGAYSNAALAVEWCVWQPMTVYIPTPTLIPDSCLLFTYWGNFASTSSYWFSLDTTPDGDGLNPRRYGAQAPYPGMIFVK